MMKSMTKFNLLKVSMMMSMMRMMMIVIRFCPLSGRRVGQIMTVVPSARTITIAFLK
jgi:hypothetical protein